MDSLAPEAILAILGAGVAVYSLLPLERRLGLHLRMHILDWTVLGASLLLVHYILFYPVLIELGLVLDLGEWRWGFTPALASYGLLLGAAVFIGVHTSSTGLSRGRIPTFRRLLEQLKHEGRYTELFFLLERNLTPLRRAYTNNYRLSRLRRKLCPPTWRPYVGQLRGESVRVPPRWLQKVGVLLPSFEDTEGEARDIVRRLLLSEDLVESLVSTRPYFGLDLLQEPFDEVEDFQQLWFSALLSEPRSILHYEIKYNPTTRGSHRYVIPSENRVLSFYFSDVSVAKERHIYRAFGDYAQSDLLSRVGRSDDRFNEPLGEFREQECWKSGFHSALRLFDIMIPQALWQGVKWHMWLYYLPGLVDGILRNMSPSAEVGDTLEWPTPYHYFLYEIVSTLRDWISLVEDVPAQQENTILDRVSIRHDNASIPKSAGLALGAIISKALLSDKLTQRFKMYLFEIPLTTARNLLQSKRPEYGKLLLLSVARAGYHGKTDPNFQRLVDDAFTDVDYMLQYALKEEWQGLFEHDQPE